MMILYPFSPLFLQDYRGFSLRVKAALRLALLGLDTSREPSTNLIQNRDLNGKKSHLCVTYVSEQSVTHVGDCKAI